MKKATKSIPKQPKMILQEGWEKLEADLMERISVGQERISWLETQREVEIKEKETAFLALEVDLKQINRLRQELRNWEETAAQYARDKEFYHGIVKDIGEQFGVAAKTSDDGNVQQDILALQVPGLVAALHSNALAVTAERDRWKQCYDIQDKVLIAGRERLTRLRAELEVERNRADTAEARYTISRKGWRVVTLLGCFCILLGATFLINEIYIHKRSANTPVAVLNVTPTPKHSHRSVDPTFVQPTAFLVKPIIQFSPTTFTFPCGKGDVIVSVETGSVQFNNCSLPAAAEDFWWDVAQAFPVVKAAMLKGQSK